MLETGRTANLTDGKARAERVASWEPDPMGRHQERWHDGTRWTEQVRDYGVVNTDASGAEPPPATAPPAAAFPIAGPPPSMSPAGPGSGSASPGPSVPAYAITPAAPPQPAGPPTYPAGYAPGYSPVYLATSNKTNGLAIASMVLGIIWLYWLGSVLALIFGLVARRQIRDSGGAQSGDGMAIAGIVLGLIGCCTLALIFIAAVAGSGS